MNKYKTLQEKAKAKGKLLLIESVSYIPKTEDIIILSSKDNKFTEAKNGKQYEARGILKNVPVTRYTENANGRIYPKEVWQKVYEQGVFEGSDSLANHSDDDGNVLDQVGVWHNMQIGEEVVTADLYCIGAAGNLLLEKVKAGGKTGFSSVGYGTLSEADNKTVQADDFEYVQVDWVMKPSQAVYATQENLGESKKVTESIVIKEQIKEENKIIENNFTNNYKEEKTAEVKKMDKFLESSLKNQVRTAIKEAIANVNYVEAIKELKEVSKTIPSEMVDSIIQVEQAISTIQEKLHEKKEVAEKELLESKETLESLTIKYNTACDTIKALKENLKKADTIVKKATSNELRESVFFMEKDLRQFERDRILMESDIKIFKEEIEKRDADIKVYEEDTLLREKDITKFKEERGKMKKKINKTAKQLAEAEKHIRGLEKLLKEEFGYDFDDEVVEDDVYEDDIYMDDDMVDDSDLDDVFYADDEYMYEEEDEDEKEDDEEELEEADEDDEDSEEEELDEAEDDDEDDDEESDDDKMAAVRDAKKEAIRRKKRAEQKRIQSKKPAKKVARESKAPVKEVVEYYKAVVNQKPAVKDIKNQIINSRSLLEAVKKVAMFENKFGNDVHKLKESAKSNKQEFVPYKFKF